MDGSDENMLWYEKLSCSWAGDLFLDIIQGYPQEYISAVKISLI